MQTDRTSEVEKRIEAIRIFAYDRCSFYSPKENSSVAVKLCTFCKYGNFSKNESNGFCKYRLENNEK